MNVLLAMNGTGQRQAAPASNIQKRSSSIDADIVRPHGIRQMEQSPRELSNAAGPVTLFAGANPNAVALEWYGGSQRTYGELERRTTLLASGLLAWGCHKGDRVAAWLEDSLEMIELYLACAKAGLVLVPLNDLLQRPEAAHQLRDSGARILCFSDRLVEKAEAVLEECDIKHLVQVGSIALAGSITYADLLQKGSYSRLQPCDGDDPFVLAYTSGTTGFPKGAVLTHRSAFAIWRINALTYSFQRRGTYAIAQGMSFPTYVVALLMTQLYLGGRVLVAGPRGMDELVEILGREAVTTVGVPSPLIPDFCSAVERQPSRLASVLTVLHGGSSVPKEVMRRLWDSVGSRYVEVWGMTENSGGGLSSTTQLDAIGHWEADDFFASVGRAAAETSIDLIGEDGERLPHDGSSVGELVARSPALFAGYWQNPAATEAATAGGWYHTGDMGRIDAAGYVYISDRRTDLIISGGLNVYPSEVERVIQELDFVKECAVVGIPHPKWGRTVVAVIVSQAGTAARGQTVIDYCRQRLASYKKPTQVFSTSELPKTPGGKVRRAVVRERVERGELSGWQ
jgi:fatty-acyl-CoA synthase